MRTFHKCIELKDNGITSSDLSVEASCKDAFFLLGMVLPTEYAAAMQAAMDQCSDPALCALQLHNAARDIFKRLLQDKTVGATEGEVDAFVRRVEDLGFFVPLSSHVPAL